MNYNSTSKSVQDNGFSLSQNNSINSMDTETKSIKKLESVGFIVLLITIILTPLSSWPSSFVSLDLVKTFIIAIGTIISLIILAFVAIKEKKILLPPKSISWISGLIVISLIVSSALSIHFTKSFFGQGFEINNASFILILFLVGLVTFNFVARQKERVVVIYVGISVAYIILYILHFLRLMFGTKFMTLGILNTVTSSIFGGWYSLSSFSMLVVIMSLLALFLLKLSSKMKVVYSILLAVSVIGTILVADMRIWQVSALIFLGLTICFSIEKFKALKKLGNYSSIIRLVLKSLPIIPVVALVISLIFVWRGHPIVSPIVNKIGVGHSELVLPWQMTLDITASTIQNYPLFGVGPNNFSQAFMVYKPLDINVTNAWSTEFSNGFALLPSFIVTQGLLGTILWILFFVFFGIISTKILRNLPSDQESRFLVISSFTMSVFLWLVLFFTVPAHAIVFFTFVLTGTFLGISYSYGLIKGCIFIPSKKNKTYNTILLVFVLVLVVWGIFYFKKTVALAYFGSGIKQLSIKGDVVASDKAISKAIMFDDVDIYWRAKIEVALVTVSNLASSITTSSSASSTQVVMNEINKILNQALVYAKKAIVFDPLNYYNYISEARVSEVAANVRMENGYENSVKAYNSAIGLNPKNPSIYLSLANLQAKHAKYDDALVNLGKSLQVKNNYLEAVFLLSQIYAAKGDMTNAIIAAKVAVQLNPQNSLLLFQLGILNYNNKDYKGAIEAFTEAIKLQPEYANARYFMGLSEARLGNKSKAIVQFEELIKTNSDNQEISQILTNLKSDRSIFNDPKPVPAPEKRPTLPIKEKK